MTKAEKVSPRTKDDALEGEGSYTAGRRYDAALRKFVAESPIETLAEAARRALDGPEGEKLREAEKAGKRSQRERPTTRAKHPQRDKRS